MVLTITASNDENIVTLPDTPCPLSPNDLEELNSTILPLANNENHGVDIYLETLTFVTRKLFEHECIQVLKLQMILYAVKSEDEIAAMQCMYYLIVGLEE